MWLLFQHVEYRMWWVDIIGYLSGALALTALMCNDIIHLRLISLVAAIGWIIYAVLYPTYPVGLLNLSICIVHIYHLRKLKRASANG